MPNIEIKDDVVRSSAVVDCGNGERFYILPAMQSSFVSRSDCRRCCGSGIVSRSVEANQKIRMSMEYCGCSFIVFERRSPEGEKEDTDAGDGDSTE